MPEEPLLLDELPQNLQTTLDKRLTANEAVLMRLSGAHGEGFVATDRRVFILREQMPIVGGQNEVDCFDYPYDRINTVLVEGAVGGGHLKLELHTHPVDVKETTLYFPPYYLAKFDAAAARIRLLAEQTRPVHVTPAGDRTETRQVCHSCGNPLDNSTWRFCPQCGNPQGALCAFCQSVMPSDARYCPNCGLFAESLAHTPCVCGAEVSPLLRLCPECGSSIGNRCGKCGTRLLAAWSRCAGCGEPVRPRLIASTPRPWATAGASGGGSIRTAEEHNTEGMRLYNTEKYDLAAAEFETALELDSENALFNCNLAVVLSEMGRDEEALEHYHNAISLAPNDPAAYLNLGYFYSEREDQDLARSNWQKVLELAPSSPEADEAKQNLEHLGEV
jgi:predicted RNA-binding Zn-ribbon protein involved in translation (DUF1610 family)